MSREDGFGFTHLVEDDDSEDVADIGRSYLDLELQPHLSTFNNNKHTGSTDFEASAAKWQQSNLQELNKPQEHFDNEVYLQGTGVSVGEPRTHIKTSSTAYTETSCKNNNESPDHASNTISPPEEQSTVHIQFSATNGKVNVFQGQLGTRSDGSRSIDTQVIQEQWSESQRPLRARKMKCLKILSIFACIVFFPFGAFAVYFAFRTEAEFNDGIMKGNIDRAHKFAKRTERLIFISFIMFLVIMALIVVAVVRAANGRSVARGPFVG